MYIRTLAMGRKMFEILKCACIFEFEMLWASFSDYLDGVRREKFERVSWGIRSRNGMKCSIENCLDAWLDAWPV